MMTRILIIDHERHIRNSLKERLEYEGHVVDAVEKATQAEALFERGYYHVVLCEQGDKSGIVLLKSSHQKSPNTHWLVLSSASDGRGCSEWKRCGVEQILHKPINFNQLLSLIRSVALNPSQGADTQPNSPSRNSPSRNTSSLPKTSTATESTTKESPTSTRTPSRTKRAQHASECCEIVGCSAGIEYVKQIIAKVAPSDARILILGSNGTGKELVAHAIHAQSRRSNAPFIEVNCAAIPSELIESELFGHEKGSFTSAFAMRRGKFEQADGGTLFLDEIGDMSLSAQAKVLRALQERRISRVGSDRDICVNVRVLAATNKNLREEIRRGNFREDLFHRLSVIIIHIPTLKERNEDIPLLCDYFIKQICCEYQIPLKAISEEAVDALAKMDWSGNIRELHNVIERLIILSEKDITLEDVRQYATVVL